MTPTVELPGDGGSNKDHGAFAAIHCAVRTFYSCLGSFMQDGDYDFVGVWMAAVEALTVPDDEAGGSGSEDPARLFVKQMGYAILDPEREFRAAKTNDVGAVFHSIVGLLCHVFQMVYAQAVPVRSIRPMPGLSLPAALDDKREAERQKLLARCLDPPPSSAPRITPLSRTAQRPSTSVTRQQRRLALQQRPSASASAEPAAAVAAAAKPPPPDPNPMTRKMPGVLTVATPAAVTAAVTVTKDGAGGGGSGSGVGLDRLRKPPEGVKVFKLREGEERGACCDPRETDKERQMRARWEGLVKSLWPKGGKQREGSVGCVGQQQQQQQQQPQGVVRPMANLDLEARMLSNMKPKPQAQGMVWSSAQNAQTPVPAPSIAASTRVTPLAGLNEPRQVLRTAESDSEGGEEGGATAAAAAAAAASLKEGSRESGGAKQVRKKKRKRKAEGVGGEGGGKAVNEEGGEGAATAAAAAATLAAAEGGVPEHVEGKPFADHVAALKARSRRETGCGQPAQRRQGESFFPNSCKLFAFETAERQFIASDEV